MEILVLLYLFVIGTAFGSFALAMVDRMHAGKDWVTGRSACASCKKTLQPRDLVPVVSWAISKGKCRYCKVTLSVAYPAVEIATGVLFLLSYAFWPYELSGAGWAGFGIWLVALVLMMALVVFDLRWFLLPNKVVYPLIFLSFVWVLVMLLSGEKVPSTGLLVEYGLSLLVAAGFFAVLFVISNGKWIGDGDIRLGLAIGLFTGSWALSWMVLLFASFIGLAVSLPALLSGKKAWMRMKIPFGPMLIGGLILVTLFGQSILDWYTGSIL